jgi:hypothetical protein
MRVIKCVQITAQIGTIAGFVLLGGTALADGGSVTTSGSSQAQGATSASHGRTWANYSTNTQSVDSGTTDSPSNRSVDPTNNGVAPASENPTATSDGSSSTVRDASPTTSEQGSVDGRNSTSPSVVQSNSTGAQSVGQTTANISQSSSSATTVAGTQATPKDGPNAGAAVAAPASDSVTPVQERTVVGNSVPVVVVQSLRLRIEPTFVSYRSAAISIFDPTLPVRGPLTSRPPAPPKTNGVLGEFTAALSVMVVPPTYVPHDLPAARLIFALLFIALAMIPTGLFAYNYGWWLRRGGYVTAPRSDAPRLATTCMSYYYNLLYLLHHFDRAMNGRRADVALS